ncbi:hypothetical protein LW316_10180 [Clostridioides difficile]|nr:hypothetical protein [Clostridioides difficile]MCP3278084.1 hypothetical protein [Clostridioides difficile]HBF2805507.1 hypothetical protein [Clostridioides difficile]HBF3756657.1 hypothetical protein [Clostridioides difficile]HBF6246994.1 hypothetical protein [Clostridioides difficile]
MKFENNMIKHFREAEVGDVILAGNNKYLIISELDYFGYVNLDTGACSSGFISIEELRKQFGILARFIQNDRFKLILD